MYYLSHFVLCNIILSINGEEFDVTFIAIVSITWGISWINRKDAELNKSIEGERFTLRKV